MCNLGCTRKERKTNKQKKRQKKGGRRSASAVQQLSSKKKKNFFLRTNVSIMYMSVCVSFKNSKENKKHMKRCVCMCTQKYD